MKRTCLTILISLATVAGADAQIRCQEGRLTIDDVVIEGSFSVDENGFLEIWN